MSIVQHLAVLALRQIVGTLVGETAADEVFKRCISLFEDQEQRLDRALKQANDEAWRALKIVLTGESVWSWLGDLCKNRGDKSFREEISALLDVNLTLGQRDQCFQELLAAEKAGILRTGRIERVEVTRRGSAFARLSNELARIEEEWRAVDQIATELRAKGYPELAKFISLRPTQPQGASLAALAVRYYFNRAVSQDAELREKLGLMIQDTILTEQREAFEFLGNTLHGIKGQLHAIQRVVSDTASSTAETRTILENLVELVKAILAIHRGPESLPTGVPVLAVGRSPQTPGPPVALNQVPYGRPLRCFRGHSGEIEQVAFSDRPTEFVHSAAWGNSVRRWSMTTGKLDRHVEELFGLVHTVFSPDGRHAHLIGIDKYGFLQSGLPRPSTQGKAGRQNLEMTSEHVSFRNVDMLYGFLVNSRPWQGGPPIVSPLAVSPDGGFLLWGDDLSEI